MRECQSLGFGFAGLDKTKQRTNADDFVSAKDGNVKQNQEIIPRKPPSPHPSSP